MNIYNVIILDESGSMSSIYNETVQSMNEVLNGIRNNQSEFPDQRHHVTIVTFEGYGMEGVKTRRDRVPVTTISPFTEKDYNPGGCTPLYDAMGKTLTELERLIHPDDRVMVTVITDGMENSSQEYSGKTIRNLVGRLREKGWLIAYIGANQDSVEVARSMNISNAMNYDATPEGVTVMACRLERSTRRMARHADKGADLGSIDDIFEEGED